MRLAAERGHHCVVQTILQRPEPPLSLPQAYLQDLKGEPHGMSWHRIDYAYMEHYGTRMPAFWDQPSFEHADGVTALMCAVAEGHVDITNALIAAGAADVLAPPCPIGHPTGPSYRDPFCRRIECKDPFVMRAFTAMMQLWSTRYFEPMHGSYWLELCVWCRMARVINSEDFIAHERAYPQQKLNELSREVTRLVVQNDLRGHELVYHEKLRLKKWHEHHEPARIRSRGVLHPEIKERVRTRADAMIRRLFTAQIEDWLSEQPVALPGLDEQASRSKKTLCLAHVLAHCEDEQLHLVRLPALKLSSTCALTPIVLRGARR